MAFHVIVNLVYCGNLVMQHDGVRTSLDHHRSIVGLLKMFDLIDVAKAADANKTVNLVLLRESRSLKLLHSSHLKFVVHALLRGEN